MNCSLPGSSVYGIFLARILEWVAISFSRGSSLPRDWTRVSCIGGGFFTTEPPGKPPTLLGLMSTTQWVKLAAAQHLHFAIFQILIISIKSPGRPWTSPLVPLFQTIYLLEQWSQIRDSDGLGAAEGPGTYITLLNLHDGLSRELSLSPFH